MSLPLPLRGKIRRDESLFLFLEILPGKIHTFAPGRSIRSLPGRFQFFPIFTFKGSLPGISKFYSSWKLRFRFPVISNAFQKFTKKLAAGKEPSRNFQKCWQLERVPTSPKEKFPKISKNVGSWKTPVFSKFYSSWETSIYWNAIQKKEKFFLKKSLTKFKKHGIIKLEKMRKGKCGNGKI